MKETTNLSSLMDMKAIGVLMAFILLHHNNLYGFFVNSSNSEKYQPNENIFNVKEKDVYNEKNGKWGKMFVTRTYTPSHMSIAISMMCICLVFS